MLKYFFSLFLVGLALASCSKQSQDTQISVQGKPKCIPDPEDPTVCPTDPKDPPPVPNDSFDLSLSTANISFERGKVDQVTIDVSLDNVEFHKDSKITVILAGRGIASATPLTFYSSGTKTMTIKLLPTIFPCPDKILKEAFNIRASTSSTAKSSNIQANIKSDLNKFICQFGTSGDDSANLITTDAAGNVYMAGGTNGILPGQTNYGDYDVFITKLDTTGKFTHHQFGSSGEDFAEYIAIDADNNVYVAGKTTGAFPDQTNYGHYDAFITKLDITGNLTHYQFGSTGDDRTTSIMTDAYGPASSVPIDVGNVYVAGNTYGTLPGNTNGGGWNDAFIIKNIFK